MHVIPVANIKCKTSPFLIAIKCIYIPYTLSKVTGCMGYFILYTIYRERFRLYLGEGMER